MNVGRSAVMRVRVPGFVTNEEVGLGDVIKRLTRAVGVRPCGGCQRRAATLNRRVVLFSGGSRPTAAAGMPAPKPGCWFAGTSCYGFVQTLKFCCGNGAEYTERWGWCIGLWFAPPCR
jgi:hypothetical protein